MPAHRSRTLQWRKCLQQICDRQGAIEIALSRRGQTNGTSLARSSAPNADHRIVENGSGGLDLIWRVRVLDLTESEIIVEQPITLGELIDLQKGVALVGVISIGQNRWLFRTTNLGRMSFSPKGAPTTPALRLAMPETVERCQRRSFSRFGPVGLELPSIRIWPLLDPKSVIVAERANEIRIHAEQNGALPNGPGAKSGTTASSSDLKLTMDDVMPEVGPMFRATIINIGGGGVGLLVEPDDAQHINRHKLFWMQIDLPPHLKTPLCVTGKVVHTHMESSQQTYAGLAFDFSFNPGHQKFMVEQITRYIHLQQREQMQESRAA